MPAVVANARNFLLSSDYPLDKVVWMTSGSVSVPAGGFNDVVVPHGLPFTPLPLGSWTTTSNWSISYEMNSGPLGGTPFTFNTAINATSTNVTFQNSNNTGSTTTLYYRMYGFMPSTVSLDAPFTNTTGDTFMFNSEYNYTKLYLAGVTGSSTSSATTTVTHGLGYRPQVAAWEEDNGVVAPFTYVLIGNNAKGAITTTTAAFTTNTYSGNSRRIHYRIYLDD